MEIKKNDGNKKPGLVDKYFVVLKLKTGALRKVSLKSISQIPCSD